MPPAVLPNPVYMWFNTILTAPTTGDIEIQIFADQRTRDEDTPLGLIEIYVK